MTIDEFWKEFLSVSNRGGSTEYYEAFYFGMTEKQANELLALVLEGTKTATSGSLACYQAEGGRPPAPGDLSIVTDWNGKPRCVIETVAVTILPFKDMSFELCRREGEDLTLKTWQEAHRKFFTAALSEIGGKFTEEMLVVFEDFKVVYAK